MRFLKKAIRMGMHPYLNLEDFDSDQGDSIEVEDAFNPGSDPTDLEVFLQDRPD